MGRLSAELEVTSWDEDVYAERDGGRKLTRAVVSQSVSGDLIGTADAQWLMCYTADGTARYVGLQQLSGSIDGREGRVVLENVGDFDGSLAGGTLRVVPGSGTGDWVGMRGEGTFRAPMGEKAIMTLDYDFDRPSQATTR
ncbi:MAG: DUF3224 domain-containing protein [Actinobacteria bacterium]|nr:DUF3224 domain-containing protein [Actinomycetota bacterium]